MTKLINSLLFQSVIKWPNNLRDRRAIGRDFFNLKSKYSEHVVGMPSVCGAIDGSLINFFPPKEQESQFVDRQSGHSLNLTAVAGPNCEFLFVSAKWPGSVADPRVLRNSKLWTWFEDQEWRPFPNAVLLGDSIYPTLDWLIPYRKLENPTLAEERFYSAHSKTRRVVECAFGILKMRFRCLFENLYVKSPVFACEVIKACTVLHNLALKSDPVDVNAELDNFDNRAPSGAILDEFGLENEETTEEEGEDDEDTRSETKRRSRFDRVERMIHLFNNRINDCI